MREKIKTDQSFKSLINSYKKGVKLCLDKLESGTNPNLYSTIFEFNLFISIAKYSKGDQKESVKQSVLDTVQAFEEGFSYDPEDFFGAADDMIWTTSLALLCGLDDSEIQKIASVMERDGVQDNLLQFLLQSRFPDISIGGGFVQKPPYEHLQKIIDTDSEEEGIPLLKNYLENTWYQEHSGKNDGQKSYWVGYHKKSDKVPKNSRNYHQRSIFFGYWAWETAAIVKIKGWDDEKLKGLQYYPYDAVHW